jgi:acetoin utilization deacetylase AcuC-like enzyme
LNEHLLPIVYSPGYVTPLPAGHRFPMPKFALLHQWLMDAGWIVSTQVREPGVATRSLLQEVHAADYVAAFCEGRLSAHAQRRIGLPWSEALVQRTCTAVSGTLLTAELALAHGLAANCAGGTHHAHADFGSGFCIFNDLAIAATTLLRRGDVKRVLIVDLDVHQGDGTAALLQDEPGAVTFSMHCGRNFPARKQASDLDVALPAGLADDAYLDVLERGEAAATGRGLIDDGLAVSVSERFRGNRRSTANEAAPGTRSTGMHHPSDDKDALTFAGLASLIDRVQPELVLYDAGVDPHQGDQLGKLALSDAGLTERDRLVLETCRAKGAAVACVIGGGYDADHARLARRHAAVHRAAIAQWRDKRRDASGSPGLVE